MAFTFDKIPLGTKMFSILIIFLLILPGIVMPELSKYRSKGEVEGAYDSVLDDNKKDSSKDSNNTGWKLPEFKLPESNLQAYAPVLPSFINSNNGVTKAVEPELVPREAIAPVINVNVDNNFEDIRQRIQATQVESEVKTASGKITWEAGLNSEVYSDKFPVGSKVNFKTLGKDVDLIITDKRLTPVNTVIIISKEKFSKYFGDPTELREVDATAIKY